MSEKSDHKSDGPPAGGDKGAAGAAAGKKGGLLAKTPVLLGGVMVLEAVLLLAGFKFLGGGARSASAGAVLTTTDGEAGEHAGTSQGGHGEGGGGGEHGATEGEHGGGGGGGGGGSSGKSASKKSVELKVVEFRAPNKQTGKTIIYDVAVYAVVKGDKADAAKRTIEDRSALIQDRVRTIMARNDPERLGGGSEPGLETLRRQVKHELDEIMGDGMVEEVLIPRCIPFGPGY